MNTFLPYPDFRESARCLDRQRLGKQRVECLQVLRALLGEAVGWRSHPAVRMWRGSTSALLEYGFAVCDEWRRRGYRDTVADSLTDLMLTHDVEEGPAPRWLGDQPFHDSHKSNLLRKDPAHYGRFHWEVPDDLPYIWPLNHDPRLFPFELR